MREWHCFPFPIFAIINGTTIGINCHIHIKNESLTTIIDQFCNLIFLNGQEKKKKRRKSKPVLGCRFSWSPIKLLESNKTSRLVTSLFSYKITYNKRNGKNVRIGWGLRWRECEIWCVGWLVHIIQIKCKQPYLIHNLGSLLCKVN